MTSQSNDNHIRLVGSVAGIGSGLTKVAVGHGFDTIKVRMQTSSGSTQSALSVTRSIIRNEGVLALYKGVSSPAVGWTAIDSLLLGALHNYRLFLQRVTITTEINPENGLRRLSLFGHGVAGLFAGCTSSLLATPMELLKVNLQIQQQASVADRQFKGPIDVARRIVRTEGPLGLWRGFTGSLAQRCAFFWMFFGVEGFMRGFSHLSNYDIHARRLTDYVSPPLANFFAGGFASFAFWITAIAPDTVKNRMMSWPYPNPYSTIQASTRRPTFIGVARQIYTTDGYRGFFRGLGPCLLRAFPVNACAYFVYEGILNILGAEKTRH
ncbi:mitochondrial carrier [Flagelloscypha sp. PMI_526]|nr:mitochondrial carrier [Flagelloscypha sp. PMI_526]